MEIYFTHPMDTYNTPMEGRTLDLIKKLLNLAEIVNLADYKDKHRSILLYVLALL